MKTENNLTIQGWLSESQMQELTGYRTTTLWKLRQAGKITFSKIGKRTFYKESSLHDLLN